MAICRNVLREQRHGVMYDSEDEYDYPTNDRYDRLSKRDAAYGFLSLINIVGVEIIIHNEDDEDEENE